MTFDLGEQKMVNWRVPFCTSDLLHLRETKIGTLSMHWGGIARVVSSYLIEQEETSIVPIVELSEGVLMQNYSSDLGSITTSFATTS